MLFKNILVPWDDSKYSNRAFKVALEIAKRFDSKIIGITCIDVVFRGHWYYESEYYSKKLGKQKKYILEKISQFEKVARKNSNQFSFKIFETHSTVMKIVSFAKLKKIDLIIIGAHGRTGWNRLFLGSVANGVAQRVKCPVLIVK